jgi:hypothetical protein
MKTKPITNLANIAAISLLAFASDFASAKDFEGHNAGARTIDHREAHAAIDNRFGRFDDNWHSGRFSAGNTLVSHERLGKARAYCYRLVELGTPEWLVDSWVDALGRDEIVVGTPSELVLDCWGDPVTVENVALPGGPVALWTYHLRPEGTTKITVAHGAVTRVHHS